jgi:hypothetical protein
MVREHPGERQESRIGVLRVPRTRFEAGSGDPQ